MISRIAISGCLVVAATVGSVNAFADDDALPEVVVTAQKRAQRADDVGISISAFSAQDLANNDVKVAEDIVKLTPSLQYNGFTPGAIVFNIRGVSQNDFGDQQEPPIAVYYDDSYASSLNLSSFPVFDLQRVEVLRGPQGTLFGRNATGGAIQYVTNKPTEDFESYITLTAGEFHEFDAEGAVSGPLTSWMQGRFSFDRAGNRGPFVDIVNDSRLGGQDNYAFRNELAAQLGDSVTALWTVRYARNHHENNAGIYSWVANYNSPASHLLGYPAGPHTPSPFGTCNGCDLSGYSNYSIDPYYGGNPWRVALNDPIDFDRTLRGTSLRLEGSVWGLNLVSISDYLNMSKGDLEDGDGGPNTSFTTDLRSQINQFTEEMRVSQKTGINDWVVGAFYMHINGHFDTLANFASFGNYVTTDVYQQTTTSVAGFAQDEIALPADLSLTLGGRYWHDRRVQGIQIADNFGSDFVFNPTTFPDLADRDFNNYSAKFELQRKLFDNTLAYVSWNRGTKSGGFTAQFTPPADTSPAGIAAYAAGLTYNPEILSAYEIGTKSKFFDNRISLDADFFLYDYKSYQAYVLYGPNTTIKNLSAKEHGVEVELMARPVSQLTFNIGVSSLRSKVDDVVLPDGSSAVRTLPQAPTWSGHASVRYEVPVANAGRAAAQWLTTYTGYDCFTVLCAPIDYEAGHAVSEGRLSFQSQDGSWEVAAFVKNAFNRIYRVYDADTSFIGTAESIYAPPRWWGITATFRFGKIEH